jgi:hypothetical protein
MRLNYRELGRLSLRAIYWLFAKSIALGIALAKLWAMQRLIGDSTPCVACGESISLLGLWECGRCKYSWYGWYFGCCEVCGDLPPFVECARCGASTMNPLIFG